MKLCRASVCNIQAAYYILALLEGLIEIFFCFYRYGLNRLVGTFITVKTEP